MKKLNLLVVFLMSMFLVANVFAEETSIFSKKVPKFKLNKEAVSSQKANLKKYGKSLQKVQESSALTLKGAGDNEKLLVKELFVDGLMFGFLLQEVYLGINEITDPLNADKDSFVKSLKNTKNGLLNLGATNDLIGSVDELIDLLSASSLNFNAIATKLVSVATNMTDWLAKEEGGSFLDYLDLGMNIGSSAYWTDLFKNIDKTGKPFPEEISKYVIENVYSNFPVLYEKLGDDENISNSAKKALKTLKKIYEKIKNKPNDLAKNIKKIDKAIQNIISGFLV